MKVRFGILLFILCSIPSVAQFTTVTGTVIDPNGFPYATGTITPQLILSTSGTPVFTGTSNAYIPPPAATGLDGNGHFAVTLADNTQLSPSGSKWNFQVCSGQGTVNPAIGTGSQCFTLAAPITISGTSQDISTQLNARASALTRVTGPGTGAPIYVSSYGAKCDGVTNDTTAINNALAAAVAVGNSTGSAEVVFPAGICAGNFTIIQGKGLRIHGTGMLSTRLRSPNANPALQINGLWYSSFADLGLDEAVHSTANAVFEIDGSYDGIHFQGTQFISLTNVFVAARGTSDGQRGYSAIALCRQGGGSGCQGSNIQLYNVGMSGCTFACYYQNGFNALANTCTSCDVQDYTKDGFRNDLGDFAIYSSSAESTTGWIQKLNGGCDVREGSAFYASPLYDFRSESVIGVCGSGFADIRGIELANYTTGGLCMGSCGDGSINWSANTAVSLGQVTFQRPVIYSTGNPTLGLENSNGSTQLLTYYVVSTAGTTGGSAPQWTYTGTVPDGTAVWTQTTVARINLPGGLIDNRGVAPSDTSNTSSAVTATRPHWRTIGVSRNGEYVNSNTLLDPDDEYLVVDASSQNITVTIGGNFLNTYNCTTAQPVPGRRPIYIRRLDAVSTTITAAHTVTINPVLVQGNSTLSAAAQAIQLLPDGYVELTCTAIDSGQFGWMVTGGNYITFANTATFSNTAVAGAVTLNAKSGFITSESLTTAAGSDYVLTFTNNRISPNSIPVINVMNGTNTGGMPTLATVNTKTNGQVVIDVHNTGSSAFNGTLTITFLVP